MKTKRNVLITGVLGGIGMASLEKFIEAGYDVIGWSLTKEDQPKVMDALKEYPVNFEYAAVDCTDEAAVSTAMEKIIKKYKTLDVVFNIVGGSGRRYGDGPIAECTMEGYQKTMDLNVKTQFLVSKYAVQHMLKQGKGCIINTTSVLGMVGGNKMFGTHTYAAAKGAIIGFSRAMATYYAKENIRVNVIAPGLIETPMSKRAQTDDAIMEYMEEKQPIYAGRNKLGDPKAVAVAAVFFADEDSDFTTGVVLPIDGGWTAQ
jgi:NAD(P)-dependent dehydrogenase (short-subunit alcohol dehydrogenase family)